MMGHLNSLSASGGGNLNKNFPKIQMPGGLPGGRMLKLRFDWYIILVKCLVSIQGRRYEAVFISILTCQLSSIFVQNFVQRTTTTLYEQRQLCTNNVNFVRIMFILCTNNVNFARTTTTLYE